MKKNYKGEFLFVLISTFVVITIWVGSDIYNKSVTSTLDETLQFQTQPIPATFDMSTIEKIKARTRVAPIFTTVPTSASESATPTTEPEPEPEPELEEEVATDAGSLEL